MPEDLEIPYLVDPNLMELTVCGHLRTKKPALKRLLNQLSGDNVARVGTKKSDKYIEVYGSGASGHLHIDVGFRSPSWIANKKLLALSDLKRRVMEFVGTPIEATISGTFFVPISLLPKSGLIRSAMDETKHGGITARKTAQTLSISDSLIKQLKWTLVPDEKDGDFVEVEILLTRYAIVNPEYLTECESVAIRAFNALIVGGIQNGSRRR